LHDTRVKAKYNDDGEFEDWEVREFPGFDDSYATFADGLPANWGVAKPAMMALLKKYKTSFDLKMIMVIKRG